MGDVPERKVRVIEVKQSIFADNDARAEALRQRLKRQGTYFINLMSSPGSGKTTTLTRLLSIMKEKYSVGVMEADIDSDVDARTIAGCGVRSIQLHTGGMCHLDADMAAQGLEELQRSDVNAGSEVHCGSDDAERAVGIETHYGSDDADRAVGIEAHYGSADADADESGRAGTSLDLAILENVGNLVCPAEFDTGAALNVCILSVPEGDDKPLKYPLMFTVCDVVLINKTDVIPYFDFDMERCVANIHMRNPKAQIFPICARTGEGIETFAEALSTNIDEWKRA